MSDLIDTLYAKREAMEIILLGIAKVLSDSIEYMAGTPTLEFVLQWQAQMNAMVMEVQLIINEEYKKEQLLYLVDDFKSSAFCEQAIEKASVQAGVKVSWTDHLGAWKGKVVSIHTEVVKKTVTNFHTFKNENSEFELTRVGTDRNPVLYIEVDSAEKEGEVVGTALRSAGSVTITS